jgi:peptidoglycan/xylan/chitin deacetylase (PgdA/CDA1 family)
MIKRVLNKFHRIYIHFLYSLNFSQTFVQKGKIGNHIIMYHGVDLIENKTFNQRFIGVENFRKQLIYLKNHTHIISLTDFFEGKFNSTKNNVAITFDDGFLNNYKYAVPILNELEIPATIYVTGLNLTPYHIIWPDFVDIHTHYVGDHLEVEGEVYIKKGNRFYHQESNESLLQIIKDKGDFRFKEVVFQAFQQHLPPHFSLDSTLDDYWKLMTDEQIKEVDRSPYVRIESHSFMHNNLGNISLASALEELKTSKDYLENLLQREVTHLAYPDGSYTRELIDAASHLGFKYQVAADGYLFPTLDEVDERMLDRMGFYPGNTWANQLDMLFKRESVKK